MSESEITELQEFIEYPFGIYANHEDRQRAKLLLEKLVNEYRKLCIEQMERNECHAGTTKFQ